MNRKIDQAKLARLRLDLAQKNAARGALADMYHSARDSYQTLRDGVVNDGGYALAEVFDWKRQELAALFDLPTEVLQSLRVDMSMLHRAVALRAEMIELQKRLDQATADLTPFARMVASMNEYAAGRA